MTNHLSEGTRLLAEATPRPWEVNAWPEESEGIERACIDGSPPDDDTDLIPLFVADRIAQAKENATLIVYAVNNLERLLEAARREEELREALEWLQEFGLKMSDQHPGFVQVERKSRRALQLPGEAQDE